MAISREMQIAGGILAATGAGVATTLIAPQQSVIAHADTNYDDAGHTQDTDKTPSAGDNSTGESKVITEADAYKNIEGDTAHDTNDATQHSSKAFEYMTPQEGADSWHHKEDWEKEPGTDNTQTDWNIAMGTNGKTASDSSSDVYGDSSEARFNPADADNGKMSSMGWVDKDGDGDGEADDVEGPNYNAHPSNYVDYSSGDTGYTDLIIDNNNNNNNNGSNNNSNNDNNGNNLLNSLAESRAATNHSGAGSENNTKVGQDQKNSAKKMTQQNPTVTQIGQNIKDNVVGNNIGKPLVINGGNASGSNAGNGTHVYKLADGTLVVDNNNNNNNNGSNNNSNNGNNNGQLSASQNNSKDQAIRDDDKSSVPMMNNAQQNNSPQPVATNSDQSNLTNPTNASNLTGSSVNSSQPVGVGTAVGTMSSGIAGLPQAGNNNAQQNHAVMIGGLITSAIAAMGVKIKH